MTDPEDLASRVAALEGEMRRLSDRVQHSERDAAAARVLAGASDRDVDEVRREVRDFRETNLRLLNAMREDIVDLRREMDERFARIDERFGRIDERFARVDENFARVDENFARIDGNFARVDENFARVDAGFLTVRGQLDATAAGQEQIVAMLRTLIDREP